MRILDPMVRLVDFPPTNTAYHRIAKAARTCTKSSSENKGLVDDTELILKCIERGHESVLEHVSVTAHIICDRGVSHELVRHRLAGFSQESTRWCNYGQYRFGGFNRELTFIKPATMYKGTTEYFMWKRLMENIEDYYMEYMRMSVSPQSARSILPNSLKTELYMTANLREWRHILKVRTAKDAHPDMRAVMKSLLFRMSLFYEHVFLDINEKLWENGA